MISGEVCSTRVCLVWDERGYFNGHTQIRQFRTWKRLRADGRVRLSGDGLSADFVTDERMKASARREGAHGLVIGARGWGKNGG